jgi:DNA-binding CsgD family transcriptional regulator/tetratricopeptide (TPR) repeat protein
VGGVLLVVGEQGIGKSALLREGLSGVEELGYRAGWAVADELRQSFPLGVMVECLGAEGRPAVAGRLGGSGGWGLSGDPVLAGVERLLAVMDRLCAVSPVAVVAEDLQWADEASVLVWRRLARAVGQLPLLVVGSVRPASGRDDLAGLAQEAGAGGGVVLELGPLLRPEVAELAGGLLGAAAGRRLLGVLARAGGNPLYVAELVGALVRDGRVRVAGGVAELAGEGGPVRVPASLAAAIGERLAGLAGSAMGVLRWAAVLGGEFSVPDLGLVTGWPPEKLAGVVEQAAGAGVVAGSGSRLGFRHGLIRQVLYEQIPGPVRDALHVQAARAMAGAEAPVEQVAGQLAAAQEAAADAGEAWVWGWLAGVAPVLAYRAPQVAAALLRRALAQIPASDPRREVLETALVTVAFLLVEVEEVERVARPLLVRTADPDRAAEVAWLLAYALTWAGRAAESAAVVEEALARPGTSVVWGARLRARQAMNQVALGHWDRIKEMAGNALADAERSGDRFAAGYALLTLGYMDNRRRNREGSLSHLDRALMLIGDDPQTTDLRLLLLANRAATLESLDRLAQAHTTIGQALALAERAGTPRLGTICAAAAETYFAVGRWDDALAALETAAALPGPDQLQLRVHGLIALIAGHRDDRAMAEAHLAAVRDQTLGSPRQRSVAHFLLLPRVLVAEQAGRPREAVAVLAECLDPTVAEDMAERYWLLPALARLALAVGDTATAVAAAQAAREEAARGSLPAKTAAADWCRGLAGDHPGPVLAAAAYYETAGRPLDRAQALEDAAVLLAGRGDLPAARRAFLDAARIYAGLGAAWDLRRADTRLRRYGIRRGRVGRRASAATGWDALSPAETEIARQVAAGRSNPDIAAALFLSRNTVQTHVSHILAKLDAHSRAEITRQALEHTDGARAAR